MASEIKMPKYVDYQVQVLWWEADEFIIACTTIGIGLMMHTIVWPAVFLFLVMPRIAKLKRSALDGAAMHMLYATGLFPLNDEFDDAMETEFYQ